MNNCNDDNDKLKVGVMGAGKMGLLHGGIFNTLANSKLSAIAEKNDMLVRILKQYIPKVKVYTDYTEMLKKEDLDIAVITTPVFLHKTMIQDAIDNDLHVFVEKPLALNYSECKQIIDKKNNNTTMVGYCRRFMETYNLAKKIVDIGLLGKTNYFHSQLLVGQVLSPGKGWLYDPEKSGGGVLIDLGSHAVDMFYYLFGEISSVYGTGGSVYNKNVEDCVSINFKMKNDLFGSALISWSVKTYRLPEFKITIYCEMGSITVTEKYIEIYSDLKNTLLNKGWNRFYKQDLTKNVPVDIGGPEYSLEDLHFLQCIQENKETMCNFHQASKTNLVLDKIYSSMERNEVEKIPLGV
jgi:predicted dehydrogenase